MRPRRSSKRAKTKTLVNWVDLPRDVMIQIFMNLTTIDLLYNAQRVCSSWRAIAKDPQLYRAVDFRDPWKYFEHDPWEYLRKVENMARLAIDRSGGRLLEFSIEYFCRDSLLYTLLDGAPQLRCLRLANCCDLRTTEEHLAKVLEKLPLLEEIEFILPSFSVGVIETIGRSCLSLKSFRMNGWGIDIPPGEPEVEFNGEAFTIAYCLNPALRSLHLLGNSMNNNGLEAILARFPRLEYLDLRRCANLDLKGDLLKKCQGIKTLRLPNDSIEDYQFQVGERVDWTVTHHIGWTGWTGESDYYKDFGCRWDFESNLDE